MKKALIITGIVLVSLIAILAVIPLFFKQTLIDKAKTTINNNVNAKVEFADLKLSFLRSFPKITLELTDVSVVGEGEFQSDTLLIVPSLRTKTPVRQLFNLESIAIEEIILERPFLNLVVGKTGNVNWDIVPESQPDEESPSDEAMELQLEKIEIINAVFLYDDRESDMQLRLTGINFDVSGEMYGTAAQLLAEGKADRFSLRYSGVNYISNVSVETRTVLNVDYDKMDIAIQENELLVNRLPLEVTGLIQIPNDSMFFDLQIKTKQSGFDNFLALVPPDYEKYLEGIQTSGSASIAGTIRGFYFEEEYPAFNLMLDVENGNLRYTDLPEDIRNISADVSITKPQGILDSTRVDIRRAHAEVKNSPVDLTLRLRNLVSDPYFDGSFVGNVNLNELKDALPLDSVNMSGVIDANLVVRGRYSAIEKEEYGNIQSDGTILLTNFVYDSPALTRQVIIPKGKLDFTPQAINLSGLVLNVGQSNFQLTGKVTNYLNYMFTEGMLAGNFQLTSSLVNLNELLQLQVQEEKPEQPLEEILAFDVPKNVNFTFQSDIRQVVFDRLPVTDVKGLITAQNERLVLDNLSMRTLDGEVKMTGSYQNTPENQPLFDFTFDVEKVDIPMAFQTISGLQRIMPIAGQSQGNLSSNLKLRGQLDHQLNLIPPTVNGNGRFVTENIRIVDSPLFSQLKGLLKADRLRNVAVDDFSAYVEIVNGTILLKPFSTQIAGQETNISGNLNTQNLLDMRLDFNVERDAFGPDVQKVLNVIPGQERILMIPASVILSGPVGKPEVRVDMEDARKKIVEEVKKSGKEELQKSINKLGEGLKNIFR
jgi:hypothetical protein